MLNDKLQVGKTYRLTFRCDAMEDLVYLRAMLLSKQFKMLPGDEVVLMCVLLSKDWDNDANRTFQVEVLPDFSQSMFEGRLSGGRQPLEKIEFGPKTAGFVPRNPAYDGPDGIFDDYTGPNPPGQREGSKKKVVVVSRGTVNKADPFQQQLEEAKKKMGL